jgi:hypothetical protein
LVEVGDFVSVEPNVAVEDEKIVAIGAGVAVAVMSLLVGGGRVEVSLIIGLSVVIETFVSVLFVAVILNPKEINGLTK